MINALYNSITIFDIICGMLIYVYFSRKLIKVYISEMKNVISFYKKFRYDKNLNYPMLNDIFEIFVVLLFYIAAGAVFTIIYTLNVQIAKYLVSKFLYMLGVII